MPTGPFAALGTWAVYASDGSTPLTGPPPNIVIIKATRKYIKYTRKCARYDSWCQKVHHGKVYQYDARIYRVSVGSYCYIEARI